MNDDLMLITGASSDIGCGLLRDIAAGGGEPRFAGRIIAHVHSGTAKLEALKAELPGLADRLEIVSADLTSEQALTGMISDIRARYGAPTRIVHLAAAKLELKRSTDFDWSMLTKDLEIQIKSIGLLLKDFLPAMAKSGKRCKVVFMLSSVTVGAPPKYMTQYTVGKYALLGYFRSLAAEYADKPICFNAVSPSMVETQFLSQVPAKFVQAAAAAHPSGRNANVTDVIPAIRFLLSSESDYISGANLPITAGSVL